MELFPLISHIAGETVVIIVDVKQMAAAIAGFIFCSTTKFFTLLITFLYII